MTVDKPEFLVFIFHVQHAARSMTAGFASVMQSQVSRIGAGQLFAIMANTRIRGRDAQLGYAMGTQNLDMICNSFCALFGIMGGNDSSEHFFVISKPSRFGQLPIQGET